MGARPTMAKKDKIIISQDLQEAKIVYLNEKVST
jgi:hypothetical protein